MLKPCSLGGVITCAEAALEQSAGAFEKLFPVVCDPFVQVQIVPKTLSSEDYAKTLFSIRAYSRSVGVNVREAYVTGLLSCIKTGPRPVLLASVWSDTGFLIS